MTVKKPSPNITLHIEEPEENTTNQAPLSPHSVFNVRLNDNDLQNTIYPSTLVDISNNDCSVFEVDISNNDCSIYEVDISNNDCSIYEVNTDNEYDSDISYNQLHQLHITPQLRQVNSANWGVANEEDINEAIFEKYTRKETKPSYHKRRQNLEKKFRKFILSQHTKAPVKLITNTELQPYNLVAFNSHDTFCDTNFYMNNAKENYNNATLQCCSQVTRAANLSMIFVGKMKQKMQKDQYVKPENLLPNVDYFSLFKRCIDATETHYFLSEENLKNATITELAKDFKSLYNEVMPKKRERTLILNLAIFTVCYEDKHTLKLGILTFNGKKINEGTKILKRIKVNKNYKKIKENNNIHAIFEVDYEDAIYVRERRRGKKQSIHDEYVLEHCESTAANLLRSCFNLGIQQNGLFKANTSASSSSSQASLNIIV